jgi:bifunctional non-homologous end joining protein LigD
LLYFDGQDLRNLPLFERKKMLREALEFKDPLRYTEYRDGDGVAFFEEACSHGWEGILAKNAASPYLSGRSREWLKIKCTREQEFVIGGYTDPQGERIGFGALLLGYYEAGKLRYAGRVGTGFDEATLRSLSKKLASLETTTSPFADDVRPRTGVHWTKPKLVAQVAFSEWTQDGKLRHPRFLGLRTDKRPEEVVREI